MLHKVFVIIFVSILYQRICYYGALREIAMLSLPGTTGALSFLTHSEFMHHCNNPNQTIFIKHSDLYDLNTNNYITPIINTSQKDKSATGYRFYAAYYLFSLINPLSGNSTKAKHLVQQDNMRGFSFRFRVSV